MHSHLAPKHLGWRSLTGATVFAATAFMLAAPVAQAQTPPPQVQNLSITADPHPYDAPDAGHKAVEDAFAAAKKTGRKVLIEFGANWCPDCRVLSGVLKDPAVAPWVEQNFAVASVNVDHFNQNMDIAQKYGITIKSIPVALIITPDGKVLNADTTLELGNARTLSAQAVVDKLNTWLHRS